MVRSDFTLAEDNAPAVVNVCRRLDGIPLAIELAAARTRMLDPNALLQRLAASLDALGTGAVDMPERQRTLRATVEWSVGLLDDQERSLLETLAVVLDGWTTEAAAQVCALGEDATLDLTEALIQHSLVVLDHTDLGTRARMLETIREYVAERLALRPDVSDITRRHAECYCALAALVDERLREGRHDESLERLQVESGNLATAVEWYLANEPERLPHLFRVLWAFWFLREQQTKAREWVDRLLPDASSLQPEDRAELLWTAQVLALEIGDDAAALSASEQLEPLLPQITDPFLNALCTLAMAWTRPIVGDFDGAHRDALASLEQLRTRHEPFWTALAAGSLGFLESDAIATRSIF
jgi:predicted ATPase